MATGPTDIQPKLDRIAELLIERDMRYHGFMPYGDGWYDTSQTAVTDLDNPVAPGWIPGPGGPPTGVVISNQQFNDISGEDSFNPTTEVYDHWPQRVAEIFEPFLDCPLRDDYDTLLSFARNGTEQLSLNVVPGDSELDITYADNPDLRSALDTGSASLADLHGEAMNAFRLRYWGRLEGIFDRYSLAARSLWVMYLAQSEIWANYWDDLEALCDRVIQGLDDPQSVDIPFTTIATISGILGKLPAVGPVFSGIGTAATILGTLQTAFAHEPTTRGYSFDGDAHACEDQIVQALRDLSDDVRDQEEGLAENARSVEECLGGADFRLDRPVDVLDADQRSDVITDGDLVVLDRGTLEFIARDILQAVATTLRDATTWNRVSIAQFAFRRPAAVGRATIGPYNPLDNVCERLNLLCDTAAATLDDVAEVLMVFATNFELLDDAVGGQMEQHLAALDN
ncbi:hypothetical protein [Nocardioides sp. SYSU D00038]|uniref:hypothetical protein n=1 Tax=Nocardioides sp. SYSU D00038 TaxID=2812554 RepID=UPI00196761EE|nr:hypothetical protein [Nocardioides sp. SYSU D00038]